MAAMNIFLPDAMKEWVEAQAKTGCYSDAADYVRDLIQRDQERGGKIAELRLLITEGIESGIGTLSMDELLKIARERVAGDVREDAI